MEPLGLNTFFYQIQPAQVFNNVMVVVDSIALILILILIIHFYKNKDKIKVQEEDKILGKLIWYSHHDSKLNDSQGFLASIGFLFLSVGFVFSLIVSFVDTTLHLEFIISLHIAIIALMTGFALMFFFISAQFSKPHLLIHEGGIKYRRPYSLLIPRRISFSKITGAKTIKISPLYGSDANRGGHRGLFIRFTHRKPMRFTTGWVEGVDRAASIISAKATWVDIPSKCSYCNKESSDLEWCKYCGEFYCWYCEEERTLVHVDISCIACQHRRANKHVAMWLVPYVCIQCIFIVPMVALGINPFTVNFFKLGSFGYFFDLYGSSNLIFAFIFLPFSLGLHASNAFRVAKIRKLKVRTSFLSFNILSLMVILGILFKVIYYMQGINSGLEGTVFIAYLDLRFMLILAPLTFLLIHVWYRFLKYILPILLLVVPLLEAIFRLLQVL